VPGHIVLRAGQRVVITDPKQIQDPLSEALAAVATQVKDLKERLQKLEGGEPADSRAADELQAIIDYQI
jgi:serine O-acetyltransferase